MEDWQSVLDLVGERSWKCRYSEGETALPAPRAETVPSRPADAECPKPRVWPRRRDATGHRAGRE